MRTGFPQTDARDDFDRARRQACWVKLAGWLGGRPSSRNRLLVLGEVTIVTGASRHRLASEAAVPIDQIVGSVEPTLCFDRRRPMWSRHGPSRPLPLRRPVLRARWAPSHRRRPRARRTLDLGDYHRGPHEPARRAQRHAALTRQQLEEQRGCTNLGRRHDTEQVRSRGIYTG
jgi:hypothetical protein